MDGKNRKILVANLGSTSFKYRLFGMSDECQMARGSVDRIGSAGSRCTVEIGDYQEQCDVEAPDHAAAVRQCFAQLTNSDYGCLRSDREIAAIGFKAVFAGHIGGVRFVDDKVLVAMEEVCHVAPAHNPPYVAAMRTIGQQLPDIPLVAAFESGFHETIPDRTKVYAVPRNWSAKYHIRRWGYHGASHRYIAGRSAELLDDEDLRVISCHLGGSSSLCAIRSGESVATTMGMSPQSGLPQNNRAGDFDPFALPWLMEQTGQSLAEILHELATNSGLRGLSGSSGDMRDLQSKAAAGDPNCQLALDHYITEIRRYLGGMLVELAGVDVIVFTGGIGENGSQIRAKVCCNLDCFGIVLDPTKNESASGEGPIHAGNSSTQVWIIPTNEELVVARQTDALLSGKVA